MGDDRAGEHDAEPAADAEDGGEQADGDADAVVRQLVAHDADGQRQDGSAGALDGTGDDHQREAGGQRSEHRARRDDDEHGEHDAALAGDVAEAAEDRREDRRSKEVGGQHPADAAARGVQVVGDGRQCGCHHRLQDGEREARQRHEQQDECRVSVHAGARGCDACRCRISWFACLVDHGLLTDKSTDADLGD
jgi:hypothetical protein